MKESYKNLRDHLLTNIAGLQEVDLYNGQYDNGDTITTPAIYIEYLPISWQDAGKNTQTATVTIRLHIVQINYASTRGTVDNAEEFTALDYLDFIQSTHQLLQGWQMDNSGPLVRTISEQDSNHDAILIDKVQYNFEYHDTSTDPERDYVPVTPSLVITHPIQG